MAADFDDLLGDLEGDARQARLELLRTLRDDGCSDEELRAAVDEDRLILLPVERVLEPDAKFTGAELAERAGVELDELRATYAAFGLPVADDHARVYGDADARVIESLRTLLAAGVSIEQVIEMNRVLGRAMYQVAAVSRAMVAEALFHPGIDEHQAASLAAAATRELVPKMAPVLAYTYERHLRELLRSDVISVSDIAAGRTANARDMAVAFADLVGFTRLGEELSAEELGAVAQRLEQLAARVADGPVKVVKTIGDAVMLVSPRADALLDVSLSLVDAAEAEGDLPQLRVGLACGPALERAGDFYGSPVNQASRVSGVARAGSVLTTESLKDVVEDGFVWSFAGERKLKGVGPVKLYRARRAGD